jgi:hypothetical protein
MMSRSLNGSGTKEKFGPKRSLSGKKKTYFCKLNVDRYAPHDVAEFCFGET